MITNFYIFQENRSLLSRPDSGWTWLYICFIKTIPALSTKNVHLSFNNLK